MMPGATAALWVRAVLDRMQALGLRANAQRILWTFVLEAETTEGNRPLSLDELCGLSGLTLGQIRAGNALQALKGLGLVLELPDDPRCWLLRPQASRAWAYGKVASRPGRPSQGIPGPTLGERLRTQRVAAGLTQETLANAIGVSRCALAGAEAGRPTLKTSRIERAIATAARLHRRKKSDPN